MIHTSPDAYKASPAVSFSRLKVFDACPFLYFKRFVERSIPDQSEDTKAMRLGTAAHKLILEGRAEFDRRYITKPETYANDKGETKDWNANAALCRVWEENWRANGKTVLTRDEAALLDRLEASVRSNPEAVRLLGAGEAEVAIERPAGDRFKLALKGRLDWISPSEGYLVDLKTIENLDDLPREIERRLYYRQKAHYRHLAAEEFSAEFRCAIIGVEKADPGRCGVYWLSPDLLEIGDAENFASLANLARAYETGDWGGNPATVEIGPSADLKFRHLEPTEVKA
jgi:hypothetical protein